MRSDPAVRDNRDFVRELESIVSEMHRRGVVHLDLKHLSNLMVSSEGRPVVLDFASALHFSQRWFGGRLMVRLLGEVDRLQVINWKRRLCPGALSVSERRMARLLRALRGRLLPRNILDGFLAPFRKKRTVPGRGRRRGAAGRPTEPG